MAVNIFKAGRDNFDILDQGMKGGNIAKAAKLIIMATDQIDHHAIAASPGQFGSHQIRSTGLRRDLQANGQGCAAAQSGQCVIGHKASLCQYHDPVGARLDFGQGMGG